MASSTTQVASSYKSPSTKTAGLVAAAYRVIREYTFAAAQLDGKPISSEMELEMTFRFLPEEGPST